MIIALLALALAMIVGGLLTAFAGWDIVLVERGWTMVIAGSAMAASGALLLGIVAVVAKLGKIQRELARLQGAFNEQAPVVPRPATTGLSLAALSGGLLGGDALSRSDAEEQDKERPETVASLPDQEEPEREAELPPGRIAAARLAATVLPFSSRQTAKEEPSGSEDDQDLKVPDFLLSERLRETYVETRTSDVDASLYDEEPSGEEPTNEPEAEDAREEDVTPAAWPEAEAPIEPFEEETVPEEAASEEEEEEPRTATVIGTYNSGDNRYVMFSDGSIEAQTPKGVFHFKSLDELKAFIAAGGENNSSTAI